MLVTVTWTIKIILSKLLICFACTDRRLAPKSPEPYQRAPPFQGSGKGSVIGFDGKKLYAGKELWKETLPLRSGYRVYRLQGIKSSSWYEVKISYPASVPALFSLQLLRNAEKGLKKNQLRRLLNTEKLIFKTFSFEQVGDKDGLYVLVTVEPEGIVAVPNFKERSFVIYNIVCEEQLLGIAYSCWSVVVLVVLCLAVAVILPRFLPPYLLSKDGDRKR
ncbi:Caveolin-1 protein [Hirschfeldia incana]|nr:Caveolin-1 protein [Hirschfeldia incana]